MKNILIVLLSLLLFSCNNAKKNKNKEVIENSIIENQGVAIAYDDSKTGDTGLVFIHGFGINKTYWKNQTAFFEKKYRVIAIDLPGFGLSGKNRNSWAVEDFSKDVTAVLTQLDLKNVILIGHSMSGAIALETALNNPTKIIGIIGIDNFKNFGKNLTPKEKEESDNIYKVARANFKKVITEYANQGFFATSTDTIIRKRVMNDVTKTNSEIGVTTMEEGDKYPIDQKLKLFKRTLYLINSDLTPTDTLAFEKNNIEYKLLNIGTTGHYPMIEKPNEFNLLLQQTFSKILNK